MRDVGGYMTFRAIVDALRPSMTIREVATRTRDHSHFRVVGTFALSQGVLLATSLARVPLIVSAIGSKGYGVALAVTSLQLWMIVIISSLTDLTRVSVSESLGSGDFSAASHVIVKMRARANQLVIFFVGLGLLLAVALPWTDILHAQSVASSLVLRSGICATIWLAASCAPGAVHTGILHAQRKVALTQAFPGIAASLSLAAVAVAWWLHLDLLAFVIAPALAACAPYWLASIWGHRAMRALAAKSDTRPPPLDGGARVSPRPLRMRDLVIMSGAGAPPLYSTGLDPIVLSISRGPVAVAAYGLASRIGVLVVLLPSALYPLYWANFHVSDQRETSMESEAPSGKS